MIEFSLVEIFDNENESNKSYTEFQLKCGLKKIAFKKKAVQIGYSEIIQQSESY